MNFLIILQTGKKIVNKIIGADIFRQRSFYNASYVRPKFYLQKTCKVGIFNRVIDIFRQRSFYNASYVRPKFYLRKTCKVGIFNRVIDIFGHLSFCNALYVRRSPCRKTIYLLYAFQVVSTNVSTSLYFGVQSRSSFANLLVA